MGQGNLSKRKNLNTGEIAESVKKSLKEIQAIDGKFTEITNNIDNIDGKISEIKTEMSETEQEVKTALESKADITNKSVIALDNDMMETRKENRLDECIEAGLYKVWCVDHETRYVINIGGVPSYPNTGGGSSTGTTEKKFYEWKVDDATMYVFVSVCETSDDSHHCAGYPKQIQQVCIGAKDDRLKMRTGNIESEEAGVVWEEWVSLDSLNEDLKALDMKAVTQARFEEKTGDIEYEIEQLRATVDSQDLSIVELSGRVALLEATESVLAEAEQLQESYIGGDEG